MDPRKRGWGRERPWGIAILVKHETIVSEELSIYKYGFWRKGPATNKLYIVLPLTNNSNHPIINPLGYTFRTDSTVFFFCKKMTHYVINTLKTFLAVFYFR